MRIGRIAEIWRYPVSSVGGELITKAEISIAGIAGDRLFAIIDLASGRPAAPEKEIRWRKVLHLQAASVAGEFPVLMFPHGICIPVDDPSMNAILSDYFGFHVGIAVHSPMDEKFGFAVAQHRHEHAPMHLLTTTSLRHLAEISAAVTIDVRRFRPSVLIDMDETSGFAETNWAGRYVRLGEVVLAIREETKRCGLTFISQPGIAEEPDILRSIVRHNRRNFGVYCSVDGGGIIRPGDPIVVDD